LNSWAVESARPDQRREAGVRTRARLLDAALDLLAERGEDGVVLRELTEAAGANVAAVSYHFGSLQSLCDAAIEHALERYLDAQQAEVSALAAGSTVEEVAAAIGRPIVRALAGGGRDLDVMRIVARSGIDPPQAWDRFDATFERIRRDVVKALRFDMPDLKGRELTFRIRAAVGLLNWVVLAPVGNELRDLSAKQIERRLVPVVAGALRGAAIR
jgi:AcrR family transcriptional regulator